MNRFILPIASLTVVLSVIAYFIWPLQSTEGPNHTAELADNQPRTTGIDAVDAVSPSLMAAQNKESVDLRALKGCDLSTQANGQAWHSMVQSLKDITSVRRCIDSLKRVKSHSIQELTLLLKRWADFDLEGALDATAQLDAAIRAYILPLIIEYAAILDGAVVQRWLANNTDANSDVANFAEAYYIGLAKSNPQEALQEILVAAVGTDDEKLKQQQLLSAVLEEWGKADAEGALRWLEQQRAENPDFEGTAVNVKVALLNIMVEDNNRRAERYILELPDGPSKNLLLQRQIQFLAELDGQIALEWAQSIGDIASREIATGTALEHWAESDVSSEEVMDFILAEPDKSLQRVFLEQVSGSLAGRNSAEFAGVFDRIAEPNRPLVAEKIVRNWVSTDFTAAKDWVDGLPVGLVKDIATQNMVTFGSDHFSNPSHAIEVTQSIQDIGVRYETSRDLLLAVAAQNKDKARSLFRDMSYLSPGEKQALESMLE